MTTSKELAPLIRALGKAVEHWGPHTAEEIRALEQNFGVRLPADYRQFIGNYGALAVGDVLILGIGGEAASMASLKLMLHHLAPQFPLDFIPIELLGQTTVAGFMCEGNATSYPIVRVNVEAMDERWHPLAPSFYDYLHQRLLAVSNPPGLDDFEQAIGRFEQHVERYQKKFDYDHATGGRLPRNHDWRPYRYCIQDVLFGATVVRHDRVVNCLEVDVFLTAHVPEYDELAGALAISAFLLSEAYKCGGTMEIRFTSQVEGGRVPEEWQRLAARYGISFSQAGHGRILSDEAKRYYASLTAISPELQSRLHHSGRVRLERACFVVHHGIWTLEQMEMLAFGSQQPERILAGISQPHERHLYLRDLLHVRGALLAGTLDRRLLKRDRAEADGRSYDLEGDVRPLQIEFDAESYAKWYLSPEPIKLGWHTQADPPEIGAGERFQVLIRARDLADIPLHLRADVDVAATQKAQSGEPTFVLLPQDFMALPTNTRQAMLRYAASQNVGLLVCPDFVNTLDREGAQKLARSRVLRQ